jgi:hypothetical protein
MAKRLALLVAAATAALWGSAGALQLCPDESSRCISVREERQNSCASAGQIADGETVRTGYVGGGRGARPETFSTFEHTRGGNVARVEI